MSFDGCDPQAPRRADRVTLSAEAGIRRAGSRAFQAKVYDLSPEGCRIEFVERPQIGERVWVKFSGLESLEGTVRWVQGHVGGIRFERPIYDAVFQKLANRES